jgi:hypothetical protein
MTDKQRNTFGLDKKLIERTTYLEKNLVKMKENNR